MSDRDDELRGALFRNDRHEQGDSRPNAKGRCQILGVVYFISSWTKTDRNNNRYQQLRFERAPDKYQPAGAPQQAAASPVPQAAAAPDPNFGISPEHDPDDIPF